MYSLVKDNNNSSLHQSRQLDYIAQFSSDIRYFPGLQNIIADALSRIESLSTTSPLFYVEITVAQNADEKFKRLIRSGESRLKFKPVPIEGSNQFIFADISTGRERVYLLLKIRYDTFFSVHRWFHPGSNATSSTMVNRFVRLKNAERL